MVAQHVVQLAGDAQALGGAGGLGEELAGGEEGLVRLRQVAPRPPLPLRNAEGVEGEELKAGEDRGDHEHVLERDVPPHPIGEDRRLHRDPDKRRTEGQEAGELGRHHDQEHRGQ